MGDQPRSLGIGDLDNDGDLDVVVVVTDELGQAAVKILRNDTLAGAVVFSDGGTVAGGEEPALVVTGEIDGYGQQDLITINKSVTPAALGGAKSSGPAGGSVAVRLNESGAFLPRGYEWG